VSRSLLSIIVPVFNEAENLPRLHAAVSLVTATLDLDWEFVFVDDGSTDATWAAIEALRTHDPAVTALRFSRNFGSHVAIAAGLDHCRGDAAVIMAADLQDPPEVLREFVARWRDGFHIVWGARIGRDDGRIRSWLMRRFYTLVRHYAIPTYPAEGTGSFCLITRPVIGVFRQCAERNRLTFGLIAWSGFRETQVPYHRPRRASGESKWSAGRLVKSAIDTFAGFSYAPIRAISYLGLVVSMISFLVSFYVLINKLFFGTKVEGWTSVMLTVLILGGVQLVMIGVLGEYLWRVLEEARGRPLYIVERSLGIPSPAAADVPPALTR
jgi:polyisoprenyl-phosphate glycosyltransferase